MNTSNHVQKIKQKRKLDYAEFQERTSQDKKNKKNKNTKHHAKNQEFDSCENYKVTDYVDVDYNNEDLNY